MTELGRLKRGPDGYADWLQHLKQNIAQVRQRAALAVNAELALDDIGREEL